MSDDTHAMFNPIVAGARADRGMPSFVHLLPVEQMTLLHQYLIKRAHDLVALHDDGED